jgi:PPOX class probable F420-dependent enzyme
VPRPPVSDNASAILAKPNAAVMATTRPDGQLVMVGTWYLWENERLLLNMYKTRKRVARLAHDPRVSLTVLDRDDVRTYVSLYGKVAETLDDIDCRDIDRLSMRYDGVPWADRAAERVTFLIDVERWHGWGAART